MVYLQFQKAFRGFPVFSLQDIKKRYPDFDNRRLVEWQQKGYIQKIRREYYCFSDQKKDEFLMFFSANKIYAPSYVSLETALDYYGFIPEGVFLTTSITSRNTARYDSPLGAFSFHHVKLDLFFGYKLVQTRGYVVKIAEPEKVILDYLYLKKLDTIDDMEAMRWDEIRIRELLDFNKLESYLAAFDSKVLNRRILLFKKHLNA